MRKRSMLGVARKRLRDIKDRAFDGVDFLYRHSRGLVHLPPYSLRQFVGGSSGFLESGKWFLGEFQRHGLIGKGTRILDIGCGCGRLAYTLGTEPSLAPLELSYVGMDIDARSIGWCMSHITPRNPRFTFYRPDLYNSFYNPQGLQKSDSFRFPHADESFDLIILTSVFTHLMENELKNYLREIARLLSPSGTAYATFFSYKDREEAVNPQERRHLSFPYYRETHAVADEDFPEGAIAFRMDFLDSAFRESCLRVHQIEYRLQDVFLLRRVG